MDVVEDMFKFLEGQGCTIECGVIEKSRRKKMSEAMKKLKEIKDENKHGLAKRLARYYFIFDNMGAITTAPEFPFEEDKYGLHYVHVWLHEMVDDAKRHIADVIKAIGNDEELDTKTKERIFEYLYDEEQMAEIKEEERKKIKKFKENKK